MPFEFKIDKKARAAFDQYAAGKPTSMLYINSFEDGKQSVLTKMVTPLTSILKNQFGFSMLVVVDPATADELNKYDAMAQRLIPNGFSYKKLLYEDDKMYIKLKVKDDAFDALLFATPANYEDLDLMGQNLQATFQMGLWINFEKQTAGTFLKIVSIIKG